MRSVFITEAPCDILALTDKSLIEPSIQESYSTCSNVEILKLATTDAWTHYVVTGTRADETDSFCEIVKVREVLLYDQPTHL